MNISQLQLSSEKFDNNDIIYNNCNDNIIYNNNNCNNDLLSAFCYARKSLQPVNERKMIFQIAQIML